MITINKINQSEPYNQFINYYNSASSANQKAIEAVAISSFNSKNNEVESRFVNLKYINNNEWIFFSNYNSQKSHDFLSHTQISALFYWTSINVQIRIKANIQKTLPAFSDSHFNLRSDEKNALAISSNQSSSIDSYENVVESYKDTLENKTSLFKRPEYWGGYSFTPYYFEFWEGHESRLNKRNIYKMNNGDWNSSILQP